MASVRRWPIIAGQKGVSPWLRLAIRRREAVGRGALGAPLVRVTQARAWKRTLSRSDQCPFWAQLGRDMMQYEAIAG
jgi:hypothetical protein